MQRFHYGTALLEAFSRFPINTAHLAGLYLFRFSGFRLFRRPAPSEERGQVGRSVSLHTTGRTAEPVRVTNTPQAAGSGFAKAAQKVDYNKCRRLYALRGRGNTFRTGRSIGAGCRRGWVMIICPAVNIAAVVTYYRRRSLPIGGAVHETGEGWQIRQTPTGCNITGRWETLLQGRRGLGAAPFTIESYLSIYQFIPCRSGAGEKNRKQYG